MGFFGSSCWDYRRPSRIPPGSKLEVSPTPPVIRVEISPRISSPQLFPNISVIISIMVSPRIPSDLRIFLEILHKCLMGFLQKFFLDSSRNSCYDSFRDFPKGCFGKPSWDFSRNFCMDSSMNFLASSSEVLRDISLAISTLICSWISSLIWFSYTESTCDACRNSRWEFFKIATEISLDISARNPPGCFSEFLM